MPDLIYLLGVAAGAIIALVIESVVLAGVLAIIRLIERRTK